MEGASQLQDKSCLALGGDKDRFRSDKVSDFSRDPKGYYTTLGVPDNADADAIKSAFRSKAKRLHPDINPSPIAAKQFHRLNEAYEILSDADKRAAYDKKRPKPKKKPEKRTEKKPQPDPKQTKRPEPKAAKKPAAESAPKSKNNTKGGENRATGTKPTSSISPEVCQCGNVTAQPRYVVFDMVAGQGFSVKRKEVSGIYCRTCADRAALKASLITWVTGWWAIPNGPKETIKALWSNIRGGRKPADRNTRLLVRQAKAFKERGDLTLARGTAEQALTFARTPELRKEVDTLLLSLSAHNPKHLRTRWEKPGWAPIVQLAPVIALVVWGSLSFAMSTPISLTEWITTTVSGGPGISADDIVIVQTEALNVRTGPSQDYQVLLILPKGTQISVVEISPGGSWARVKAPDGTEGFVPIRAVKTVP